MKLKILGATYSIIAGEQDELRNRYGFCDFNQKRIVYGDHMHPATVKETVLHEILHACDLATAIDDTMLNEEQINRLSAVLFSAMRDNKKVFDWIANSDKE